MSGQARVESVDALRRFRVALCKFAESTTTGLDEAETEVQRTRQWVHQDQVSYWKQQIRKRTELYTRAKSALNRKRAMKTDLGSRFSYIDEEKALAVAERRLEEARQKMENVRRWRRVLDDESDSYKTVAQGLGAALQTEIPTALAQLDNMVAALEAYATSTAPAHERSTARAATEAETGASMARGAMPSDDDLPEELEQLRAQTPPQFIRDGLSTNAPDPDRLPARVLANLPTTTFAAFDQMSQSPAPDSKVILARGVWAHQRVYLERTKTDDPKDSGWYIGVADGTRVSDYDAMSVGDLLASCPALDTVLRLPVGYVVVLVGASLEDVFDSHGKRLWPAADRQGDAS